MCGATNELLKFRGHSNTYYLLRIFIVLEMQQNFPSVVLFLFTFKHPENIMHTFCLLVPVRGYTSVKIFNGISKNFYFSYLTLPSFLRHMVHTYSCNCIWRYKFRYYYIILSYCTRLFLSFCLRLPLYCVSGKYQHLFLFF